MLATVLTAPGDIAVTERPEPQLIHSTDAIVEVICAAVCGSDLWWYRGDNSFDSPRRMGHEVVGRVQQVGADVHRLQVGDLVIAAFKFSDNTCPVCRDGFTSNCPHGAYWGQRDHLGCELDGGQGELARVAWADGTLVPISGAATQELLPHLLALADVMPTGVHAARCAGVREGGSVVVIGDGAVGLCGVLAARRAGAASIAIMSRNPRRQQIAREFGADTIIESRGADGIAEALDLHQGIGAAHILECVGTAESLQQAIGCARPGGQIGMVGLPHGIGIEPRDLFAKNLGIRGGGAPARAYIPDLLTEVCNGNLRPGAVFDGRYRLEDIAQAYADMAERRTTKALIDITPL